MFAFIALALATLAAGVFAVVVVFNNASLMPLSE
jgi:hypothetical protein